MCAGCSTTELLSLKKGKDLNLTTSWLDNHFSTTCICEKPFFKSSTCTKTKLMANNKRRILNVDDLKKGWLPWNRTMPFVLFSKKFWPERGEDFGCALTYT